MEVPWLLVAHGSVTALVVMSFLCGQWPIFEGTFIQSINHFLTFGAYHYLLRLVQAVCGNGARDLVLGVEQYCCDRPNPLLQQGKTKRWPVTSGKTDVAQGRWSGGADSRRGGADSRQQHPRAADRDPDGGGLRRGGADSRQQHPRAAEEGSRRRRRGIPTAAEEEADGDGNRQQGRGIPAAEVAAGGGGHEGLGERRREEARWVSGRRRRGGRAARGGVVGERREEVWSASGARRRGGSTASVGIARGGSAIFYVAIIGVTYFMIVQTSFEYIPGYYVSGWHRYLSVVAVAVGALLFVLTSFSDPGTVTADNVSQYVSAYAYDNIIFVEKECSTCKITRPARAKHCRICDKCVARFDHHCGWMNNCIGEKNTRYFVAFLVWHFLICVYGAVVLGFILAGELKERKVIYILTAYYGIDNSFWGLFPHVAQSFKWQDYIMWMKKENEEKANAAALKASISSANSDAQKAPPSKWRAFFVRSRRLAGEPVVKDNIYNRGMIRNLCEVIVPLSERKSFSRRKSD
nr:unnamed protein product [Digitaria exilis]